MTVAAGSRHPRWALMISGRGSNMQAVLDQGATMDVRWVLSSRASAPGLFRARRMGVPTCVLPKQIDWNQLDADLRRRGITHIFLLGFMKIVPAEFVAKWPGRILNVHPSLLPAYPGLRSIERSFEEGADMGVTVHVVTAEMDAGPRLLQKKCVVAGERPDWFTVRMRISRTEQRLVRKAALQWR